MLKPLLVSMLVSFSVIVYADSLSDAQAALVQYREASQAANEARAKGDESAFSEQQAKAQASLQTARKGFDEARAQDSTDVAVLKDYVTVLMQMGDADLAADVSRQWTRIVPDEAAAWYQLGRSLADMGPGGAAEAVKALNRALEIDPQSPQAASTLLLLGKVYRTEGLHDLARQCAEKALAIDASSVPAKLALIAAKIRDGQIAEASADLDELGAIPNEYAGTVPRLFSDAINDYRESRQFFPDTADNHLAYAKLLVHAGKTEDSLAAAERAAGIEPESYTTWNLIGALSNQLGDTTKARKAYQRSLEINADQTRTKEALDALSG